MATSSNSKRQTAVFAALLTVLGGTSLLLLAIRPAPLAGTSGNTIGLIAQTPSAVAPANATAPQAQPTSLAAPQPQQRVQQWTSVFIRSTRGASVDSASNAHFVILPGFSQGEGRLQVNPCWKSQFPAGAVRGVNLPPGCVTVVLVGDFDRDTPTEGQLKTLGKLLSQLNTQFGVTSAPLVITQANHPAAIGRNFSQVWLATQTGK